MPQILIFKTITCMLLKVSFLFSALSEMGLFRRSERLLEVLCQQGMRAACLGCDKMPLNNNCDCLFTEFMVSVCEIVV